MFLKDPKKEEKSVSLSLLIYSFFLLTIMGILECFEKIKTIGPFLELFVITTTLYFGRRLNFSKFISKKGE